MNSNPHPPQPPIPNPSGDSAHNKAVASMILGICGIVICPLACSIPAIIFGMQAKSQIARSSDSEGSSMAQAGFIMGIVGTALGALVVLGFLFIVLVSAGSASGGGY